eukprot:4154193-Pleurochrysis_carterae.AAC.2
MRAATCRLRARRDPQRPGFAHRTSWQIGSSSRSHALLPGAQAASRGEMVALPMHGSAPPSAAPRSPRGRG